ncbi:MAG: site-2 protease family protein [Oscillospiraceae bacterium]|nr:site-2 protease family protein [Oscillospiraceae bacterium]
MSILFAILLFSFLIFIHELGHFVAAKRSGVQVNEFAMFMGPAIYKKQVGETLYSIRCIPIGGYCAMEGEDEETDNPRSFQKAAWWKRLIILVAGSAMNFLAGVLIVAVVLFCQPQYASTQIKQVESWSTVGGEAGLQAGDEIVEFNGQRISVQEDFSLATLLLPDGEYDMVVMRNGQRVELENVPMIRQVVEDENGNQSMLYGISFAVRETTPQSVPGRILPTAFNHVKSVIVSLKMLLTGQAGLKDMSGPVGIVQIMSDTAEASGSAAAALVNMLYLGGFIAINLAVMNMLPLPALDGGRVFCLLLTTAAEKITRRKIDPKYEGYLHTVGMVLLLILMAVLLFKDIFVIFAR